MGFVEAGVELDALLARRAEETPGARTDAGVLRSSTIGLLGRLRGALGDEVSANKKLPRTLVGQVFAYYDLLAKLRASGSTEDPPPPPDPDPDPKEPTPTPT